MTSSQALAAQGGDTTTSLIEWFRSPEVLDQIRVALPEGMSEHKFTRTLITAMMERPELVQADRLSLVTAVFKCAGMGLLPDGREATINTYNTKTKVNGKEQWVKKATLIPMIDGYRKIVAEYGWSLVGDVVYANDEFDEGSTAQPLFHRRARLGTDRGEPIGAYALATHQTLGFRQVIMDKTEIDRVKAKSKDPNGMLWKEWWDRAWVKTCGKFLAKRLPMDEVNRDRLTALIAAEDDGDDPVTLLYGAQDQAARTPDTGGSEGESGGEPASPAASSPSSPPEQESAEEESEVAEEQDGAAEGEGEVIEGEAEEVVEEEQQEAEAAPFEGEEPPPPPPANEPAPVFGSHRYEGKTVQEVYELGDIPYLTWALGAWKTGPVVDALKAFAEQHPEIKPKAKRTRKASA